MAKKKATKRNLGREIYGAFSHVEQWPGSIVQIQERPWTAVEIQYIDEDGHSYRACGFSKVCWPDEWDADEGANRAAMKACARLAQMLTEAGADFVVVQPEYEEEPL